MIHKEFTCKFKKGDLVRHSEWNDNHIFEITDVNVDSYDLKRTTNTPYIISQAPESSLTLIENIGDIKKLHNTKAWQWVQMHIEECTSGDHHYCDDQIINDVFNEKTGFAVRLFNVRKYLIIYVNKADKQFLDLEILYKACHYLMCCMTKHKSFKCEDVKEPLGKFPLPLQNNKHAYVINISISLWLISQMEENYINGRPSYSAMELALFHILTEINRAIVEFY